MNPLQIILLIIVSLLGIPVGFLLKKFTKEEMKSGRKWFKLISLAAVLSFIFGVVMGDAVIVVSSIFLFFIAAVPLWKKSGNR